MASSVAASVAALVSAPAPVAGVRRGSVESFVPCCRAKKTRQRGEGVGGRRQWAGEEDGGADGVMVGWFD